ncbi:Pre-mRNA-splicing factor SPF27 [Lasiosphaeria hispida]|uniref:Pre-mRNA-splicing factor SPF27 n=1 Tax=Lasiosphaeria hispida TaxID=260671 RepID=A0AAJ0HRY1_9PEZI|nr:Pre-mRNA-splicing factor SPF27 [Lasiosphaeria hispida]
MPSITTIHDSLPYIDPEPTAASLAVAHALIAAERHLVPDDPSHALLPPPPTPSTFQTPLLTSELARAASGTKLSALDLSRYEAPTVPPQGTTSPADLSALLARAYAAQTYVSSRRTHLALLDTYGKNAWLVGNWQLEGEVKALERELAETKRAIDVVTLQRKGAQDEAGPEVKGLEETWRRGVARVLETEAAAEGVRREVLEVRRRG